jgi:hypothetical protein
MAQISQFIAHAKREKRQGQVFKLSRCFMHVTTSQIENHHAHDFVLWFTSEQS